MWKNFYYKKSSQNYTQCDTYRKIDKQYQNSTPFPRLNVKRNRKSKAIR